MTHLLVALLLGATAQSTGTMSPTSSLDGNLVKATGSTRSRALRDRFGDVVNILDFGGNGNGIVDNSTAILAAVSALPSKGGDVFFPAPVDAYYVSTTVTITKPGVRLVGAGKCGYFATGCATKLRTDMAGGYVLVFGTGTTQHAGPSIENLGFESSNGLAAGGVRLLQQNHVRIKESSFYRFTLGPGVRIEGGSDASILPMIQGSNFIGCKHAIQTTGLVTGLMLIGGYLLPGNGSDYPDTGSGAIGVDYSGDTALITSNLDGWPIGVRFTNVSDYAGHKVIGSRFEGNTLAIQLNAGGMVVISGNMFQGTGVQTAIELNGSTGYHVIRDNSYGGVTPLVDNTTQVIGFRTDSGGGDTYSTLVRRNTAGNVTHSLEEMWQGYGSDAKYIAKANKGALIGALQTNFQTTSTVQVGSVSNHDVEFIHSAIPVLTVTSASLDGPSGAAMVHRAQVADSGSSTAHVFKNLATLAGGQKIATFWNGNDASTEKAWISTTGQIGFSGGLWFQGTGVPTCYDGIEGYVTRTGGGTGGDRTRLCLCTSDGGGTPAYAWQNVITGTVGTAGACSP